jgi:hypothetical protein
MFHQRVDNFPELPVLKLQIILCNWNVIILKTAEHDTTLNTFLT